MGKDSLKEVRNIVLIACITLLFLVYTEKVIGISTGMLTVSKPFLIGIALAFVLNIPMSFIEEKLMKKWNSRILKMLKRPLSIILSIVFVSVIIAFVFSIVAPQISTTIKDIAKTYPTFLNKTIELAQDLASQNPQLEEYINKINVNELNWDTITEKVIDFLQNGVVGSLVSSTVSLVGRLAAILVDSFIAICFALYCLACKEKVLGNIKTLCKTYIPKKKFDYIYHITTVLIDNFKKYIAGQCIEAVIIGTLFFIVMSIMKFPYTMLISVVIAFTALIPVIGAFIGMIIGAFFILMVSPIKAVYFIITFLVVQQFENNVIYPRTVGTSVGLPAIWVFLAVTLGGSLCGVAGMLMFIPITATLYTLIKEDINRKREE